MTIYEKISAIMSNVQHIQKDDNVSFKNTNYKALSEEKVTTLMRKEMIANKLVVFPVKQECRRDGYITHVDVTYKIVDAETGESIEVVSCGDGADTQDKGAGKAMTYAYKYMWLRTFALPTGEDPDKIASAQLDEEQAEEEEAPKKKGKFFAPAYDATADYKGATNNLGVRLGLAKAEIIELLNDEQKQSFTFDASMTNEQWYAVYIALKQEEHNRA